MKNTLWNWTSNNTSIKPLMNSCLEEEEEYVDSDHVSPEEIVENFPEVSQRP